MPVGSPAAAFDLQKILSIVWRDKTTVLATTIASLLLAFAFVAVTPPRYTAVTQILIDPTDLHAVGNDLTPVNQANDAAVLQVESQVRVLTSDNVLRRVIKAEALTRDPDFGGLQNGDESIAALNALKRMVQVKRAERTYVVDVTVTSRDPVKAARIANAVAQSYLAEQTDVRSDAARQVSQSLSARLNELKDRVRQAEDRVETFKARNNILGASGQLVNEQQLSELNNQLGTARARTAAAKARLDQVEHLHLSKEEIGAFPEAVQSPTITALRSQYAEIMRREAEQMTSLGARHPAVVEIQAQAERLRHMIEEEVHRIALSARSEYESARANEETLAANLEKLKGSTIATNEALVTLRELERDVLASRAVYEAFLVRARETGEQERLDTKNIRVISRAEPPLRRSFPPSNTLLAIGALLVGVASGTGLAIMRAAAGGATPVRRRASGGAALLGKLSKAVGLLWPTAPVLSSLPILAKLPHTDISFGLSAARDQKSRFAAELTNVLDAVDTNHPADGSRRVLVVAFDDEDETLAVALTLAATAAVAATQRVLLIDTDLKRRTLAAVDADRKDAGLVDVALGRRKLSEIIVRDRETEINLACFVAPTSRRDRRITEADVKRAFEETAWFDLVIVAAVDGRNNPSNSLFAELVDHIILVDGEDKRNAADFEQFLAQIGPDARKVRGVVLTGASTARAIRPALVRSA